MRFVAYLGRDDESSRYLARRLRSLRFERFAAPELMSPEARAADLVMLSLAGEFSEAALDLARERRERGLPFFVLSAVETMKATVQSMRLGADDYFLVSDDKDELVDAVLRRLEPVRSHLQEPVDESAESEGVMVGSSRPIQEVYKLIGRIASSSVSVLLRGESGTGKELVARQIHMNSPRRRHPFVVIDCAAIPRDLVENELFGHEVGAYSGAGARGLGKFDLADHGTVFLDEISELDIDLQSKILRVIQQGTFDRVGGTRSVQVDVRTIATTQSNLEESVRAGRFRQDLYHRLNVIALYLPPLRERREDIPPLVHHFAAKHGRALGLPPKEVSAELMARFERYEWPGNVRELENLVRRALVLDRGPTLTSRFLDEFPAPGEGPAEEDDARIQRLVSERFLSEELQWKRNDVHAQMTAKMERLLLELILSHSHGNQVGASRLLGISRNTLRVKMASLGIDSARYK